MIREHVMPAQSHDSLFRWRAHEPTRIEGLSDAVFGFAITLLVDMVIFNTMDFWEGRVSAGEYNYQSGDKTFYVRHEILPGTKLKRSLSVATHENRVFANTTPPSASTTMS